MNINLKLYSTCFAIAVFVALIFTNFYSEIFLGREDKNVTSQNEEITIGGDEELGLLFKESENIKYENISNFENTKNYYLKNSNIDLFFKKDNGKIKAYINPYSDKTEISTSFIDNLNYSDNYKIKVISDNKNKENKNDYDILKISIMIFIISSTIITMILPYLTMSRDKDKISFIAASPVKDRDIVLSKYCLIIIFYILFCITLNMLIDFKFIYILVLSLIQLPIIAFSFISATLYKHKIISFIFISLGVLMLYLVLIICNFINLSDISEILISNKILFYVLIIANACMALLMYYISVYTLKLELRYQKYV